ncbi:MAG: hypothetical protein ACPG4T_21570, partial [Nannocystaceae bacterium]
RENPRPARHGEPCISTAPAVRAGAKHTFRQTTISAIAPRANNIVAHGPVEAVHRALLQGDICCGGSATLGHLGYANEDSLGTTICRAA